jgi:hypothetical protein
MSRARPPATTSQARPSPIVVHPTSAPPPTRSSPPPPPPTSPASVHRACHPLTNGGNCYEPGEFCRKTDHGVTGVAGNGETIRCEDNNGWRWEPV